MTDKSSFALIMFLIVTALFICPEYLSGTSNPTSTPAPTVPPRALGKTENFSWQEIWRKRINLTDNYENVRTLVAVKGGVLYMNYVYGDWLTFIDANKGDLRWRVDIGGHVDSIVTDGNLVYVVGKAGQIIEAYNLQTGELAWKSNVTLPGHRAYFLRLHDGHLFAYEWINLIYIFDPRTGNLTDKIQVFDIAERFLLYLENNDDWLLSKNEQVMLVKEGEIIWQTSLDGSPQKFPYIFGERLIVRLGNDRSGFDGVAGLDLVTGKLVWQRADEFYSNFVINNELLYVVSKEAKILIIEPKSGQTIGFAELLPNKVSTLHPVSAVAANENMLYVYFIDNEELIAFEQVNN